MTAKKRKYVEVELTPERIAEVIYKANKPVRLDDILAMLKVKRHSKRDVELLLHALELDGRLVRSRGTWFPPKNRPLVQGTLSIQRSGAGFVIPGDRGGTDGGDVFIAPQDLKDAWDGDIVEVLIMPHRQGPSREGRITRIIERSQKLLPVFALKQQGDEWLATPQHSGLQVLFRVDVSAMDQPMQTPLPPTYGAGQDVVPEATRDEEQKTVQGDAQKAVAKETQQGGKKPKKAQSPLVGESGAQSGAERLPVRKDDLLLVVPLEKIGPGLWSARAVMNVYNEESPAAQELLAKIAHGIPMEFPPAVVHEAAELPDDPIIDQKVLRKRKDLRDIPFVTIDGADAKDFDDAIFVERAGKGYRLLVAIADVSYYVTGASAIDNEARRRGNSYYFPLSVEPMLPEILSNGLCSLKPMVPRLGVVADMVFSDKGIETSSRLYTAVIESKARLTYDQVQAAVMEEDRETQTRLRAHMPMLTDAFALAGLLSKQRSDRGSLDFELPEAQFVFDDAGDVLEVVARTSTRANNLIEEFMIAANESVARFLTGCQQPFLYRIHEAPDMEKLEALKNFILQTHIIELPQGLQGVGAPKTGRGSRQGIARKKTETPPPSPQEFKAILQAAKNTPQEYTVNRLLLRAMMQARYSPDNEGHFGLASRCYCHFTSPIRRYADLVVHRALKAALGQTDDIREEIFAGQEAPDTGERSLDRRESSQSVWVKEKQSVAGVSFDDDIAFDDEPSVFGLPGTAGETEEEQKQSASKGRASAKKRKGPSSKNEKTGKTGKTGKNGKAENIGGRNVLQRLEQIAEHINQTERSAMDAERETHKRLSALYLRNHIGEEFDGIVSGVTDFGIFIELPSCLSEGMVRLSSLDDDYYHYLPDRQTLRGERTGRVFTIGMPVRVALVDVSLQRFEVTLEILPEEGDGQGKKTRQSRGSKSKSASSKSAPRKSAQRSEKYAKGEASSGNGRKKKASPSRNGKKSGSGKNDSKAVKGTARRNSQKNGGKK